MARRGKTWPLHVIPPSIPLASSSGGSPDSRFGILVLDSAGIWLDVEPVERCAGQVVGRVNAALWWTVERCDLAGDSGGGHAHRHRRKNSISYRASLPRSALDDAACPPSSSARMRLQRQCCAVRSSGVIVSRARAPVANPSAAGGPAAIVYHGTSH